MAWSKVHFYYAHQLSGLVATTEDSNYPVANILDGLNGTLYKGTSTATHYITFDAGSGNSISANYLALGEDNLAGATVALEFSNDNFVSDVRNAFTAFARSGADPVIKECTSISGRYSRIKLTGLTVAPQIGMAHWGLRTELDYVDVSFDPNAQEFKGNINVTPTGYVAGIHTQYYEHQIKLIFEDADSALYALVAAWWLACGMKCFFMAWEKTDHATEIWIVRSKGKFNNPLTYGGLYRNITIDLIGRR